MNLSIDRVKVCFPALYGLNRDSNRLRKANFSFGSEFTDCTGSNFPATLEKKWENK